MVRQRFLPYGTNGSHTSRCPTLPNLDLTLKELKQEKLISGVHVASHFRSLGAMMMPVATKSSSQYPTPQGILVQSCFVAVNTVQAALSSMELATSYGRMRISSQLVCLHSRAALSVAPFSLGGCILEAGGLFELQCNRRLL
mmetsp:Transcript_85941/g.134386  ORF Transcript_85941/g.134386 Transcript_85941/m.134386 type:complete len:142 (+) Transcript_85941:193-618(+)